MKKKQIDFISLHPSLAEWLCEKLKAAPAHLAESQELLRSLESLYLGESQSLMVELSQDGEAPPAGQEEVLRAGDLTLSARTRQVRRGEEEIPLTPKEFDILFFLAKNKGDVFTKEQIYQAVWDGEYLLDDSNIMAFIRKLRKKIEPDPGAPAYILTIWGIGYKFNERL